MIRTLLAAVLAVALTTIAVAQETTAFQVIVNTQNPATTIDPETLAMIFLKSTTRWPDGRAVMPVDQSVLSSVRLAFSSAVLGQHPPVVRAYWEQQIASGGPTPPPVRGSDTAAIAWVAENPGGVAYVSANAALPSQVRRLKLIE